MKTKSNNSFRQFVAAAALVGGLTSVAGAGELSQVHVNYSDLNVNGQAGAAVLYQRIRNAADQVCGAPGVRDLGAASYAKACKVRAIGEAVAAVHSPALTQVYEVKMGVGAANRLTSL